MKLQISEQQTADSGVHIKTAEGVPMGWFGTSVCIDGKNIKAKRSDRYGYELMLKEHGEFAGKELMLNDADIDRHIGRFNDPQTMLPKSDDADWIMLYRRNPDRTAGAQKYLAVTNVWRRKKYRQFWAKAVFPNRIRLLKKNGKFLPRQLDTVNDEAQRLLAWCEAKHQSERNNFNYMYMKRQIRELVRAIAEEAPKNNEPFYIL